ncbi:hypothetical protein LINPERHAP1_LOCUS15791 [Linum perenne]
METRCRFGPRPPTLAHHHHFHRHHRCPIICPEHGRHNHEYRHCHHRQITTTVPIAGPPQERHAPGAAYHSAPPLLLLNTTDAGEATSWHARHGSISIQEEAELDELLEGDAAVNGDDDPIFVMTDEWKEFFAASETRRRLEKQQRQSKK